MTITAANDRIFTTLKQLGAECPLEEVMDLCPDITWNQAFLAIDQLSRTGHVLVRVDSDRVYWIRTTQRRVEDCAATSSVDSQAFEHELNVS